MIRGARANARFQIGLLLGSVLLVFSSGCSGLPGAPLVSQSARATGAQGYDVLDGAARGVVMTVRAGANADQIAQDHGGTVVAVVPELGLYRIALPVGDDVFRYAQALMVDTRVAAAEVNGLATIAEGQQSSVAFSESNHSWSDVKDQGAFVRVGVARAQTRANGNGVIVAILDTGIQLDHPALAARLALPGIEPGVSVSPGAERAQNIDSNHDGTVDGALGHGTHVAGIVLAVAPGARLLPVRVLDSDGIGTAFDVAVGIVQAAQRGAQVINMSLGLSAPSGAVLAAVRYARAQGAVVVAPTGNDHLDRPLFPASIPEVVAVAGLDPFDQHASFTNFGPGTDLAAPSVGILSTYFGGGYARWSGTSMAAPFVSGTAALLYGLMLPRVVGSPSEVESCMLTSAFALNRVDPPFALALGAGRIDAGASLSAFHRAAVMDGELERLK